MSTANDVRQLDALRERLNHLHDGQGLSWREIARVSEFNDVPAGTLCSIANGRDPKDNGLRRALGLPPKSVEVEPCPDCGEVHEQLHQCPDDLARQREKTEYKRCASFGYGEPARRLAERWDEVAAEYGGMTGLARGILNGEYRVEEVEQ